MVVGKVSLLAKFVAHEGKGNELVAAFASLFEQVEREPGTEVYALNRSSSDPNTFWFYELYTDGGALGAHGSSDVMQQAMVKLGELIAESEMIIGEPVRAKGLDV
jgi:(4S)-4-hydroxy-5-phosphonooxypentane-2,3-dione isomerase